MSKRFVLNYELSNGKIIAFEFNRDIDYHKYNLEILKIYGKNIIRRYVYDKENNVCMSLKQLDKILENEKDGS